MKKAARALEPAPAMGIAQVALWRPVCVVGSWAIGSKSLAGVDVMCRLKEAAALTCAWHFEILAVEAGAIDNGGSYRS
jgi:hypothetical protein